MRACVFVDGENFRHSLKRLFQNGHYRFGKHDYLPQADWHQLFASIAGRFNCELLRTYWYGRARRLSALQDSLQSTRQGTCAGSMVWRAHPIVFNSSIEVEIDEARRTIEGLARVWREIQGEIENQNDKLEFRRSGSISYELATRQFGVEKGVDTQLTADMVTFADMYDAAIILSGDADYLPPVAAVSRS